MDTGLGAGGVRCLCSALLFLSMCADVRVGSVPACSSLCVRHHQCAVRQALMHCGQSTTHTALHTQHCKGQRFVSLPAVFHCLPSHQLRILHLFFLFFNQGFREGYSQTTLIPHLGFCLRKPRKKRGKKRTNLPQLGGKEKSRIV